MVCLRGVYLEDCFVSCFKDNFFFFFLYSRNGDILSRKVYLSFLTMAPILKLGRLLYYNLFTRVSFLLYWIDS